MNSLRAIRNGTIPATCHRNYFQSESTIYFTKHTQLYYAMVPSDMVSTHQNDRTVRLPSNRDFMDCRTNSITTLNLVARVIRERSIAHDRTKDSRVLAAQSCQLLTISFLCLCRNLCVIRTQKYGKNNTECPFVSMWYSFSYVFCFPSHTVIRVNI